MKELKGRKLILILGMPLGLGCIYFGNPAFAIVTTLIMILGIDEFFKMCELKGSSPNRIFGFIITLFVALAYAGIYSHHQITVLGFCCAAVISVFIIEILNNKNIDFKLNVNADKFENLVGDDAKFNADKMIDIFKGEDNDFSKAVCLNTAAGLIVNESHQNFADAYNNAREHILSNAVIKHLETIQNA